MWEELAKLVKSGDHEKAIQMAHTIKNPEFFGKMRSINSILMALWHDYIIDKTEDQIMETYPHVQTILTSLFPNKNSLHKRSIDWRKPVGERFGRYSKVYRQAIYDLGITSEESLQRRQDYTNMVRERLQDRHEVISEKRVYEIIDMCSDSIEYQHQIIAVMLATGSRLIEVLKVSKYLPLGRQIVIEGLAKTSQLEIVTRPLIRLTSDRVIEMVEYIRSFYDFASMSEPLANSLVNGTLNNVIESLIPECTSHKLRYIWAALAWELYGGNTPQQEWVREMFAHKSADTTTTYLLYKITLNHEERRKEPPPSDKPPYYMECGNFKYRQLLNDEKIARLRLLESRGIRITRKILPKYGYSEKFYSVWLDRHKKMNLQT